MSHLRREQELAEQRRLAMDRRNQLGERFLKQVSLGVSKAQAARTLGVKIDTALSYAELARKKKHGR